jgi:lipoyl-dependent peroxiredoxin
VTNLPRGLTGKASARLAGVDSLQATATLRWEGLRGRIEGGSGALSVATATQAELGGPGGESNPEELFSAALANCFTSTLTSLARARGVELAEIETTVSAQLAWDEHTDHHLSDATLHAVIASPAPEADVRRLVADAEAHCPVCQAIAASVALHVTADVIPT